MPDLQFHNAGSFVTCWPMTDKGKDWAFDNLLAGDEGINEAIGDCLWPVCIEHRYLEEIVLGARGDGLVCEG